MYSTAELVLLARWYLWHTGIPISRLGIMAARNDKLFIRLFQGLDCTARSAERASDWFDDNWPEDLPWPRQVRRRIKPAAAAVLVAAAPPREAGAAAK